MNVVRLIFISILLIYNSNLYSKTKLPKDLSHAINIIVKQLDTPTIQKIDSLDEEELFDLCFKDEYKLRIIVSWDDDENKLLGVQEYLNWKGVLEYYYQIMIRCLKNKIETGYYNEEEIFNQFTAQKLKDTFEQTNRFELDTLDGEYIPRDLNDAIKTLDAIINDSLRSKILSMSIDSFLNKAYYGFGRHLRNRWKLWIGSRLSNYFHKRGICHPEPLSSFILSQYYYHLLNCKIEEPRLTDYCDSISEVYKKNELEKQRKEYVTFNIGDTIFYTFPYDYINLKQKERVWDKNCICNGIVIEKKDTTFALNVKILNTCSSKGIVVYSNYNSFYFDKHTGLKSYPTKRITLTAKKGDSAWFNYSDWEKED